ncbi:MAG: TerB family tellurite resistance protein [Candidatus Aminicenantes bacterium]|nr:TerB family tellurite resistance protein [Candidatus Aminicenantes bacterium]MDH5704716.1 TerB family tellurite resistance protein [Candidatus Aminicenantes bacterium]
MALFSLKKVLLKGVEVDTESQEQVEAERVQVATCIILLEVAKSDDEFSSIEKATVKAILKKKFDISAEAVEELMEVASRKREESIDLWEFTNLINVNYSKEEKKRIVESAWRVIYADEKLDGYEDHFVHKLAKLLQLDHSDLIEAKLKVKYENKP